MRFGLNLLNYTLLLLLIVYHMAAACRREFPVTVHDSKLPVTIGRLHLSSNGSSGVAVKIKNLSPQPIRAFLLMIELRERDGTHISTIPLFTRDPTSIEPLPTDDSSWLKVHDSFRLSTPIKSNEVREIEGWSPLALTRCPLQVEASVVELQFTDRSMYQ
jgi:hypothetical protein